LSLSVLVVSQKHDWLMYVSWTMKMYAIV